MGEDKPKFTKELLELLFNIQKLHEMYPHMQMAVREDDGETYLDFTAWNNQHRYTYTLVVRHELDKEDAQQLINEVSNVATALHKIGEL